VDVGIGEARRQRAALEIHELRGARRATTERGVRADGFDPPAAHPDRFPAAFSERAGLSRRRQLRGPRRIEEPPSEEEHLGRFFRNASRGTRGASLHRTLTSAASHAR
jgi:hypothetical protein